MSLRAMRCGLFYGVCAVMCAACDDDPSEEMEGSGESGGMMPMLMCFDGADFPPVDASACVPPAEDYQPGANDAWPACAPDDGSYPLYADTPSSIERVAAYERVMTLLAGTPSPQAFSAARAEYSMAEGLESRVQRREDLRFPEIPMEQWDPGLDPDKQCNSAVLAAQYPDRCAGPQLIAPLLNEAFASGQAGEGIPEVHAARIKAGLLWFLHLSVFKEANTCFTSAPKDCDSSWAYYTGGYDRQQGIGLSNEVRQLSPVAHQAIWDGFAAFRCLREIATPDASPALEDLTAEQRLLFDHASAQLRTALDYGLAQIVRAHVIAQATLCDAAGEANWAFLQVLGPVLDVEGNRRDAVAYAPAAALWGSPEPMDEASLQAAVLAIDTVFACP